MEKRSTSWEGVESWSKEGRHYHQTLIFPGVVKLCAFEKTTPSLLDLGCGEGELLGHLPSNIDYWGVDLSPTKLKRGHFLEADATMPLAIKKRDFSHVTIVLALQNMEVPQKVIHNAAVHLKPGGQCIIVLNHPCFRIPRQSSWQIDEPKKLQFRRIDTYMTPQKIPIAMNPSRKESLNTLSFHFPLSSYTQWLFEEGFTIEKIEEWCSNKTSSGSAAKMENRARREFPLLLRSPLEKVYRTCAASSDMQVVNSIEICLDGLKFLEYRGYDSAGIAGIQNGKVEICKEAGKVCQLEKKVRILDWSSDAVIGHTRWATHGKPTENNAHPHTDVTQSLALIHNGIIENYGPLKRALQNHGLLFQSETDTEVIAQLIAFHYKGDVSRTLHTVLGLLKGSFAIALVHKDWPGHIFAACRDRPLSLGYDDERTESLLSSDPNLFWNRNLNIFYLQNDEVAVLTKTDIAIYDPTHLPLQKKPEKLDLSCNPPSKGGFEHFMIKEIHEQPLTIQEAMAGRFSDTAVHFEELSSLPLTEIQRCLFIGCGTSWHAGYLAADLFESTLKIPCSAEIASEMRYKELAFPKKTLSIAISQSGETADTIAAARSAKEQGAILIAICNAKNSYLSRIADYNIPLRAGPEISVCSTKAFTSQITVLMLLKLHFLQQRQGMTEELGLILQQLKQMPHAIQSVLDEADLIAKIARKYSRYEHFFFMGRRYMYPTCMEAALKLKEISYLDANAYAGGELKHGPIALIDENFPVVAFLANHQTLEKMRSNLMEVKARGAPLLVFAPRSADVEGIADDCIIVPETKDELAPFPSIVAAQLFAYYIARQRGREIDQPRNLAKSVTVE